MNIKILPQQNRRLHQLIGMLGLAPDNKALLVSTYTDGRTESSTELLQTEASALINFLDAQVKESNQTERCNKMRKKILSICHQMGWYKRVAGVLVMRQGRRELDYDAINKFCTERGPYKQDLNQHTYKQLVVLVGVFENVLKSELNKTT